MFFSLDEVLEFVEFILPNAIVAVIVQEWFMGQIVFIAHVPQVPQFQ
jgi:hypothetical protein